MNIYEISVELKNILSLIEENGGELTYEAEQQLIIQQANLQQKALDYAYVIKNLDGESDIIDAEIERLTKLKRSRQNTIKRLKETILEAMLEFDVETIKTPTMKLATRNYPIVEAQIDFVPEKYKTKKVVESMDKRKLKADLNEGKEIEGATLKDNFSLIIS